MDETRREKIANYLGLAQRAGKMAAGDMAAREALRQRRAFLLVLAADAAPQVREELTALAGKAVPILTWPDMYDLGRLLGKSRRGAAAVLDQGFAQAIRQALGPEVEG